MNKKLFIFSFFCLSQNLLYSQETGLHFSLDGQNYRVTEKQLDSIARLKDEKDKMNPIIISSQLLIAGILKKYTSLSLFPLVVFTTNPTSLWFKTQIPTHHTIDSEEKTPLYAFQAGLQQRFPDAQFETMKIEHPSYCYDSIDHAASPDFFGALIDKKTIILNFPAINFIDSLYKKQLSGQAFTQEENDLLDAYSFIMLHESTHLRHNDPFNKNVCTITATAGLEAVRYAYRSKHPIKTPKTWKNLPLRCGKSALTFSLMTTTLALTNTAYSRYCEKRADDYAIQHATDNQLTQGKLFLKNSFQRNPSPVPPLLRTHPSDEDRILAIDQEIQRRQQK
jgi:hypothetical protein